MCLIKIIAAKKNRSKAVEKNAPYKNDCGQKNNQTVLDKQMKPYKNEPCQKNRSKAVEKNGAL